MGWCRSGAALAARLETTWVAEREFLQQQPQWCSAGGGGGGDAAVLRLLVLLLLLLPRTHPGDGEGGILQQHTEACRLSWALGLTWMPVPNGPGLWPQGEGAEPARPGLPGQQELQQPGASLPPAGDAGPAGLDAPN